MFKKVILASASPRRKELLKNIFPSFEVVPSNVDEILPEGINSYDAPQYLSKLKAFDIAKKYPDALVIGSDTSVIIDNEILGKPKDEADAFRMLKMLSNNTHYVVTGCTLVFGDKSLSFSEKTAVKFFPLNDAEIEEYIKTKEPFDKAGAYGIQAKGSLLVEKIDGDYFNVVGLPIAKLNKYIKLMSST